MPTKAGSPFGAPTQTQRVSKPPPSVSNGNGNNASYVGHAENAPPTYRDEGIVINPQQANGNGNGNGQFAGEIHLPQASAPVPSKPVVVQPEPPSTSHNQFPSKRQIDRFNRGLGLGIFDENSVEYFMLTKMPLELESPFVQYWVEFWQKLGYPLKDLESIKFPPCPGSAFGLMIVPFGLSLQKIRRACDERFKFEIDGQIVEEPIDWKIGDKVDSNRNNALCSYAIWFEHELLSTLESRQVMTAIQRRQNNINSFTLTESLIYFLAYVTERRCLPETDKLEACGDSRLADDGMAQPKISVKRVNNHRRLTVQSFSVTGDYKDVVYRRVHAYQPDDFIN
ncbi:MAG: hypothetical protein Q8P32_00355 [Candidatus Komeilibacteria bacterium]|nr:hypothetical protein [Candidatus Komeilibacteria bacterium]